MLLNRKILVARHGERVDFTFNLEFNNWVDKAFDHETHKYQRFDINMPRNIWMRSDGYKKYELDSPLTEIGYVQAKLTGRALRDNGVQVMDVYASPALRCVQTAMAIVKGLRASLNVKVEPGLFEWCGWYRPVMPSWIDPNELHSFGFPINTDYQPLYSSDTLTCNETISECYERCYQVSLKALEQNQNEATQLCGGQPRSSRQFYSILSCTPYLSVACASEVMQREQPVWKIVEPPVLPLHHTSNDRYDWSVLQEPTEAEEQVNGVSSN